MNSLLYLDIIRRSRHEEIFLFKKRIKSDDEREKLIKKQGVVAGC